MQHDAQQPLEDAIRRVATSFLDAFEIPGMALAIIPRARSPILIGLGVRAIGKAPLVDIRTQFAIASNSKAFLAACLALEVDRGNLAWDDPVVNYLPEFRMADPAVTRMMTVRDLLVHRSGLPLGAGDLMLVPGGDFTADQVLAALRHFRPDAGFRVGYAYDNVLYVVAGLVLERVSGLSWNDYLPKNVLAPLGMAGAVPNGSLATSENRAARHNRLGPPVIGMGPLQRIRSNESDLNGPAGGIHASVTDIVPWLNVQLDRGRMANGERLWSEAQTAEMWTPQTIITSGRGPSADAPHRAVIEGYALGWGVNDYRGNRMLTHGGQLAGATSRIALLPDAATGIAIFSNSGDAEPIFALRYALLDLLLGAEPFDWLAYAKQAVEALHRQAQAMVADGPVLAAVASPSLDLARYAGRYRDPWYGDIEVSHADGGLAIRFLPTPAFSGPLEPFGPDMFRTRFPRGAGEDAIVHLAVVDGCVTGVTMRALSPVADFSFDYHHLSFVPVPA